MVISLRRELQERPSLRFSVEAGYAPGFDEEGHEDGVTPAIHVKITNIGKRPISLDRTVCVFKAPHSEEQIQKESSLHLIKLGWYEAADAWINLYSQPEHIERLLVVDSTAKEWVSSNAEMKTIRASCARLRS